MAAHRLRSTAPKLLSSGCPGGLRQPLSTVCTRRALVCVLLSLGPEEDAIMTKSMLLGARWDSGVEPGMHLQWTGGADHPCLRGATNGSGLPGHAGRRPRPPLLCAGRKVPRRRRPRGLFVTHRLSSVVMPFATLSVLTWLALVPAGCSRDKGGTSPPESGDANPCASPTWSTGDTTVHLTVDGLDRQYILHVPPAYTGAERVPLVVDMHGFGAAGARQEVRSGGWKEKADEEGFIVAFPTGSPIPVEVGIGGAEWSAGDGSIPAPSAVDDVGFIRKLVATIESEGCVDSARIYATGVSNGGAMAHWLGCEATDLFAAIAPVDSDIMGHPCNPSRSIPVVFFRATDDTTAPYGGGEVLPGVTAPGALISFEEWRTHDACTGGPVRTNSYCSTYASCDRGSEVVLCSLAPDPGGPPLDHGGSYSYPFANGFKLVDFAWTFLLRFTLP
jgi:poly(3-hydroxybutyrate) depolymerase